MAADKKYVRRCGVTAVARWDLYSTRRRACYSMGVTLSRHACIAVWPASKLPESGKDMWLGVLTSANMFLNKYAPRPRSRPWIEDSLQEHNEPWWSSMLIKWAEILAWKNWRHTHERMICRFSDCVWVSRSFSLRWLYFSGAFKLLLLVLSILYFYLTNNLILPVLHGSLEPSVG